MDLPARAEGRDWIPRQCRSAPGWVRPKLLAAHFDEEVCYEIKTSRADFLWEMKQPLKRRIGLRYSNEFYFVAPAGLLNISEIPVECGLIEIGIFAEEERNSMTGRSGTFAHFDPVHSTYCRVTVPAAWRETPGPTWQFVAGMLRNQQKIFQGRAPKQPNQQRLPFFE
jgi:hypothetical protein